MSATYRVRQFFSALFARVSEQDLREAEKVLGPEAQRLFCRMRVADQRHALNVMHTLTREGYTQADLLTAALLHDVGKSAARIQPWHRAIIVLTKHWAPGLLDRLTGGEPRGWRRPFVIHRRHPEIGAGWAAQAGCSPLAAWLIQHHQDPLRNEPHDEQGALLAALQRADNAN